MITGAAVTVEQEAEVIPGIPVKRADNSVVEVVRADDGRVIQIRYPNGSKRELRYAEDGRLNYMKSYPAQVFIRTEPESNWTDKSGRQWNIKDISVNMDGDITFDTMTFREVRGIDGKVELHFPNGTALIGRDFEGNTFLDKTVYPGASREFGYDKAGTMCRLVEPSGRVWTRGSVVDDNGVGTWQSNDGKTWRGKVAANIFTTEVRAYRYVDGAIATVSGTSIIREQDCGSRHDDIIEI
jgi:hypothetical protein